MELYGLIGRSLGHSFSKRLFEERFSQIRPEVGYALFELPTIEALPHFLESHPQLRGFNVTIPYKEAVIPYLDRLSPEAEAIGAVNCVKREPEGWVGYNTDYHGFLDSLETLLQGELPERALVLGTGGASKAVQQALHRLKIPYEVVSRDPRRGDYTYETLRERGLAPYRLVVNATPIGTYPAVEEAPALPYPTLTPDHRLFDLVYNPPVTAFLAEGRARGARTLNGEPMLLCQAEASWRIWGLL